MFIKKNKFSKHSFFMSLAQKQAERILGQTHKNPPVGCIITKNGFVVSAGHTGAKGRPHAEVNAINSSKENLENSELYSTLEPCSHYGFTPPCTKLIIKKKIKKVFFSIEDPDIRSYKKCKKILNKHKIEVNIGINKKSLTTFYDSYIKFKKKILPFVTFKLAVSKDFFTIHKKRNWITNKFSRGRVHLIRSNHDCIITSSRTIIKDNPELTCRIKGLKNKSPARIILDRNLNIPLQSRVIRDAYKFRTFIFYNKIKKDKIKILRNLKVRLYKVKLNKDGYLNLMESLIKAKNLGFSRIFAESGITLMKNLFSGNLIDEFKLFISNKKITKNGYGNTKIYLGKLLKNKKKNIENVNLFNEKLISYKIK